MSRTTRLRALWPFFFALALELVRRLREIADEVLELLLEVLLGDLLRLALETSALRHLAVDAAGGDEGGEEVLAKLRIRHRALDVRLERVRRQRGARLGLRHAWYHLSFDSAPKYVGYDRPRAGTAVLRPPPEALAHAHRRRGERDALRVGRRCSSSTRCAANGKRRCGEPGASASGSGRSPAPRRRRLASPRAAEGPHLRRRRGDTPRRADARREQAPAAGRELADDLLPAPAPAARRDHATCSSSPGRATRGR